MKFLSAQSIILPIYYFTTILIQLTILISNIIVTHLEIYEGRVWFSDTGTVEILTILKYLS